MPFRDLISQSRAFYPGGKSSRPWLALHSRVEPYVPIPLSRLHRTRRGIERFDALIDDMEVPGDNLDTINNGIEHVVN